MQEPRQVPHHEKKAFHRSHTHLLTALAPLVIGELVKDSEKRWRWIRISSIVVALIGEAESSWQDKVRRDRENQNARCDR
jgi:hypothetical protein